MDAGRRNGQQGSVAVEAALIMIPLLLLVLGVIDFGRLLWTRHVVFGAAAEGARLAIVHDGEGYPSDVEAVVQNWLTNGGVTQPADIVVGAASPSAPLTVSVGVDFHFIVLPGFVAELSGARRITGTATAVAER